MPSAFLVISHRNAEGTGVVGRVASVPKVGARDTFDFEPRRDAAMGVRRNVWQAPSARSRRRMKDARAVARASLPDPESQRSPARTGA